MLAWPASADAAAPLGYFWQAYGPAAIPTMHLGWGITALCVSVVVLVFFLLAGALLRRRPPADERALGKEQGGLAFVYIGVGLSTVALLITLAYTLVTLEAIAQPSPPPAFTVKVTAHDWWWEVRYEDPADADRPVTTANEIHIPTGVPVRIELESVDVLHAFWVPQLAGKTQAIPGQVNTQWIQADVPGVYRGQCAAFCGAQHAHMGFEVVAQPPALLFVALLLHAWVYAGLMVAACAACMLAWLWPQRDLVQREPRRIRDAGAGS